MKSKLLAKLLFTVCLCLATAFIFTACKDKEIYANHSDFESYPEYWNSFNSNTGDIYLPDTDGNNDKGNARAPRRLYPVLQAMFPIQAPMIILQTLMMTKFQIIAAVTAAHQTLATAKLQAITEMYLRIAKERIRRR